MEELRRGILVTTSRRPSPRTRSLIKDLVSLLPRSFKVNRGHFTMDELAAVALSKGCDRLVVVGERKGNPSIIRVYKVERGLEYKNIVSMKIRGFALSRELRRSLPASQPDELYVKVDEYDLMDFAEAFILGFHAKIYHKDVKPKKGSLIAIIKFDKRGGKDIALLEFINYKGEFVGPRLRLQRTQQMIKNV
jgi:U3 small nucleolar ribonucleoprotein protein IMP4